MWLERLAGQPGTSNATSQPYNRSYSPAPRRPSHLAPQSSSQRPGLTPRSSSLSGVSNASTTSLLVSSTKPGGSGLKQSTTAADFPDPLETLRRLIGSETTGEAYGPPSEPDADLDLGRNIEFGRLSLEEFTQQKNQEATTPSHKSQTVEEYEKDAASFRDLHESIRACDDILNSVEINLTKFQNDLGAVSAEIETLQARSTALSTRLENRQVVERRLGPIVEELTLSPLVVKKISEGAIDEGWIKALAEVEKRSKTLDQKSTEQRNIKGVRDLGPLLKNLVNKSLERIRDFLAAQIKSLRSPSINAQIIQQQHFLPYKDLYTFLSHHHPTLGEEIGQAYMNTMRWYYLDHFTRYLRALEKVKLHAIDQLDLLGQDNPARKAGLLSGAKPSGPPHDAFNLGRRIDIIKNANQPALPSYLAEEDKGTHYLEFPFRNVNLALIDNASAEYSFLTSFFAPARPHSSISRYFNYIFEPTFALVRNHTTSLIATSVDCLGILICVRLNQHFAFELQRRKIPVVDGYINGTSMLLWPRFQQIMDLHCDSVRRATSSLSSSIPSSKSEQAKQSAAPHFLTQRFGQFLEGIVALSAEAGDDEPVATSLGRLRSEVEAFLTKMSKSIAESRKRERFLFNNYSLVLTILGDLEGKLAGEQRAHFEGLRRAYAGAV